MITIVAIRLRSLLWMLLALFMVGFTASIVLACDENASSTFAYDGQRHLSIVFSGCSLPALGYDSGSSSLGNGRKSQKSWAGGNFLHFANFLAAEGGTRALQLPAADASLTGTTTLGYTTPSGDVFLQSGLSRAEQLSTLRHESVHAFFSPSGSGSLATFRQNLGQWGYDNSQLLRYSEEAMAETYGSGSLLQGLRHPLVNGYGITPGGLFLEGGVVGGGLFGAGYLGYQMGGGGH